MHDQAPSATSSRRLPSPRFAWHARRMLRLAVVATVPLALLVACKGHLEDAGTPTRSTVPKADVDARAARQRDAHAKLAANEPPAKQILFGDLHVHTTFSVDAFLRTLPMLQGEGAHPPADACDFARFCSDLDFWSINDHSEGVTPEHWKETKEAVRQCNAIAGDPKDPDLVTFLGWEWTQVGATRADHYGHKNVILKDTAEDKVPTRPISARAGLLGQAFATEAPLRQRIMFPLLDWSHRQRYLDFGALQRAIAAMPACPTGVPERQMPVDCYEAAQTPAELFAKLDDWGFDTMVIPHGTTWGFYTPPGTTLDKQLVGRNYDPQRQFLFEIYSGHGNSEEWRPYQAGYVDDAGNAVCPAPTKDFLPCCWRAGEIMRQRCADPASQECEATVAQTREMYVRAGVMGARVVPGAKDEDWLDCDQCKDCFLPSFKLRPGNSAQYALAITNFDDPAHPRNFQFGFIGSSDNHSARPGTGYKEYDRRDMTETAGARDATWRNRMMGQLADEKPADRPRPLEDLRGMMAFQLLETERQASFFMTGGLVAVHSAGRDRDAIWDALHRREVYGTSGPRILLWFDLLNGPDGKPVPMGGDVALGAAPRFRVRAAGSFVQKPGCPEHSLKALGQERLQKLCRGECYNPSDVRHRIDRIEVVRIRPQVRPGEPVGQLIDDPWRKFDCAPDPNGCVVEFDDPDFAAGNREALYYVRAIQEPTLAINAGGLRCTFDKDGNCTKVNICYGDYRTPFNDDCLAPAAERAWSSPIWVRPSGGATS